MKTIALFPGQGSQHVGMAKDLCDSFAAAREVFEEASDATHLNLKKLCFDGPESDLTLTEHTQPCLLAASVAAYRSAINETGFAPDAVAGHSLGEYSALVAAGVLPLGRAAAWVRERGLAMQQAVPAGQGSMAAILGLEDAAVEKVCAEATAAARAQRAAGGADDLTVECIVEPANFNAPGQVVVAGSRDAVAEAVAGAKAAGGKAIPLQVSAPFHCKLMQSARARMADLFSQVSEAERPRRGTAPYVPNRTARLTSEPGVVFNLLVEQVDHPVLWRQSMTALLEAGAQQAIEFGPGKVLAGLAKRIAQPLGKTLSMAQVSDAAGVKSIEAFLKGGTA